MLKNKNKKIKEHLKKKVNKLNEDKSKAKTPKREKPELSKGYTSKISAIFVALNHISSFNKGYEITRGANGLYYIRLLTDETYRIK